MSEQRRKYNVTVLNRDKVPTYPKVGEAVIMTLITYIAAGLPPHTVRIPKDKWTTELERITIKESIESRLKERPETYKV